MTTLGEVTICSNALQRVGAKPISSFDNQTDHARLCKQLWPTIRDSVLRAHPWNCATRRVILAPEIEPPAFDFSYQFLLPGDWLKTTQVGKHRQRIEYRSEGRYILANVEALPLVFVYRNEDVSTWSSNLLELAEIYVAASIAYPVTKSTTLRDSIRQEAATALKVAKAVDGQDDPPEEIETGRLIEARFSA